jgi:hypothetical protein
MTSIQAAIFRRAHEPLAIEPVEIDTPPRHEVRVRIVASGVCHSDLHYVDGENDLGPLGGTNGTVLGHDGTGIVEAVGEDVTDVQPGDHVVACVSQFCGHCDQCLTGHPARCRTSFRAFRRDRLRQGSTPIVPFVGLGTYAEMMLVHENNLVTIDPDIPLDRATLLGCGVTTGVGTAPNTPRCDRAAASPSSAASRCDHEGVAERDPTCRARHCTNFGMTTGTYQCPPELAVARAMRRIHSWETPYSRAPTLSASPAATRAATTGHNERGTPSRASAVRRPVPTETMLGEAACRYR